MDEGSTRNAATGGESAPADTSKWTQAAAGDDFVIVTSRETLGSVDSLEDYVEKIEDAKLKAPDTYGP